MIRKIFAAVGFAIVGLLILAAPASADPVDTPSVPGLPGLPSLPSLGLGFNPTVQLCTSVTTPIPLVGVGMQCTPDLTQIVGIPAPGI